VDRGSTFHFTIRLGLPTEAVKRPVLLPPKLAGRRVLVIDDNATNRQILEGLLKSWHMEPVLTDGGAAALAALQAAADSGDPFRLILLDLMMPDMDGFDVIEQIKQRPGLAQPTIVMLSSAGQCEHRARCRALGAPVYLIKPIKASELFDSIISALALS